MLLWGQPRRTGITDVQSVDVESIETVNVKVDDKLIDLSHPPQQSSAIVLELNVAESAYAIPFTDVSLAVQWAIALQPESV